MSGRYGLEIRGLAQGDIPGLAELLSGLGVTVPQAALARRADAVRAQPGCVLLAHEWGPPSGIVVASWCHALLEDAPLATIGLLLVAEPDRRRGIGRLLLKAASRAARAAGCATIALDRPERADDLEAFARASGFQAAGHRLVRPLRRES